MKMNAVLFVCLSGVLCLCASVKAATTFEIMKEAALSWKGPLPCLNWDCDCAFRKQRGCCCVANEANALEEATFTRLVRLWQGIDAVQTEVADYLGNIKVAFTAAMGSRADCFGPFTTDVPIPYNVIHLNDGFGFNPSLGVFTAPENGVYSFSFTTYSNVGDPVERLYQKVQLMKNGVIIASMWEDNREDMEDSATQVVVLSLLKGDQVYVVLASGRNICGNVKEYNTFSGYILYPLD